VRVGTVNHAAEVVVEKRLPPLRRRTRRPLNHVFGDSSLANGDSELEEFAVNPWSTPQRVVTAHLPDEGDGVRVDSLPTGFARAAFPFPEETESFAMPSDYRIGLDDQKVGLPGMPVLGEPGPQSTVQRHQARSFVTAVHDEQLMSQSEILKEQAPARFHRRSGEAEHKYQPADHVA